MRSKKTILYFVPHYLPGFKSGGVVRSVNNFVENLGDEFDIKIICNDHDVKSKEPYKNVKINHWNKVGKAKVFYSSKQNISFFGLINFLKKTDFDIIFLNSFFSPKFTVLPLILRLFGFFKNKKCVITTRGELSPGALKIKKLKKFIFINMFKKILYFDLHWQVSSKLELVDVKNNLDKIAKNIYIIPDLLSKKTPTQKKIKRIKNKNLRMIFLSRISPIKNLHFLINVLSHITKPIDFFIYGNKEDLQYWRYCKNLIEKLPPNIKVFIRKEVNYKKVSKLFRNNDLFAFPTKSENFGHVILESLSVGTCVILSDKTPWKSNFPALNIIKLKKNLWIFAINEWLNLKNKELEKRRTLAIQYFLNAKKENKKSKKLFENLIFSLTF